MYADVHHLLVFGSENVCGVATFASMQRWNCMCRWFKFESVFKLEYMKIKLFFSHDVLWINIWKLIIIRIRKSKCTTRSSYFSRIKHISGGN